MADREERGSKSGSSEGAASVPALDMTPVGFTALMDLRFVSLKDDEVVAELTVSAKHYQPMGIVHGGVYCAMVETVCSVGGYLHSSKRGQVVVGVDNHTSFLKATRTGLLRCTGKPLATGRRTQLWEANVHDEKGQLLATGRVRLICLDADQNLAGQTAGTMNAKAEE